MAKDSCVLLSNSLDRAQVLARLQAAFGDKVTEVQGESATWTRITVSRRKLFAMAQVTFVPLTEQQVIDVQKRLKHVYSAVEPEIPHLHVKLMAKIASSRMAIEVQAPKGLRGLEDVVFVVSSVLDAVIFWEGNKMLDKMGSLIMDFAGKSGIGDLDVMVDAALDARAVNDSAEAFARKKRSEALLKAKNVPVNPHLPLIEDAVAVTVRSAEAVTQRALALMLVAVKGEGLEDAIVQRVMADYGIAPFLTPKETAFIQNPEPDQQSRVNFCWRYEGLATLLWALGYQAELAFPDKICDVAGMVTLIRERESYVNLLAGAQARSVEELLDQADLIYRLDWAVVDARLKRLPTPGDMEAGVVYERHYALNWLIGFQDQEWDDVRTDT